MAENSPNNVTTASRHATRVRAVCFTPESLMMFCAQDVAWLTSQGIPEGSKLLRFNYDPIDDLIRLWIEHESFEPVELGTRAPEHRVEMKRLITKERMEEYSGKPIDGQNQLFVLT